MSDYNSGLPIRSEADGADERVHVKVVDGTTPSQRMTVDTDSNAHVEMHGNDPAGTDRVVRTSEEGALTPDGLYDASNNTKPGTVGLIAVQRASSPGFSDQIKHLSAITNSTVHALDVSIHDENGAIFSETNPLPVIVTETEGTPINDYKKASAIAAAASDNHDYTVTAAKTMYVTQIEGAASGKAKFEIEIESASGSGSFATKFVKFNSTASPDISIVLREPLIVTAGAKVRVVASNLDNQAQDLYSTISGHEV